MNVIQEIAAWAKKLPVWQSDALRRVFTSDTLAPCDEEEILTMLLAAHKIPLGSTTVPHPVPFSEVIQESAVPTRNILLRELHSLVGVNALVPAQSIKFALNGLTVIYGENGAGKSGYARVLKHACHAREKGGPILPNVTQQKKVPASAVIELSVGEEEVAVQWRAGTPPSDLLAEIAVFDAHCARVFIDEANEVNYLPYGLDVFGKLAAICKSLKEKIVARLAQIPERLTFADEFKTTTNAGRFLANLTATSDVTKLDTLSRLDDSQLHRLQDLRALVATAKTNPPKQQAARLRRIKSRFEQLQEKVTAISAALSDDSLKNLKLAKELSDAAAKAADLALTQAFVNEPLPGTGSDPWRILFDAAKAFSEQTAYRGEEFPVTRDDAVCVLCQQPLSRNAAGRLQRFKEFVLADAAEKKTLAATAFHKALQDFTNADTDYFTRDKTLGDELRAYDSDLAAATEAYFSAAAKRNQSAAKAVVDGTWDAIPTMPTCVAENLKCAVAALEASAVEFDKADKPEELLKLQEELSELEDRELLGKKAADVRAFIDKKKLELALRSCEKAVDTTAITRAGSELMERAVTEQLTNALRTELNYFDVQSVPLNVRTSGEKGKTKRQLTIPAGVRPSGVLSEGEQRVVAIASFLAELSTSPTRSPIIFDDPVSSLDHLFRERVAKRFVAEAKERQVVIFTHDIVMLLALERECAEQRVAPLVHTIRRSANGPGECPPLGSRPWHASSTKDRLGILRQTMAPFKKLQAQSQQQYELAGAEFYGKLREAWERAIEEVLLQDVIQRFRPSVETLRLKKVLIETADYPIVEREMTKCSTWMTGHDAAAALGAPFPSPQDVEQDLNALDTFVKTLRDRAKKAEGNANALIDPPKAQVSQKRATRIIDSATVTALT